MYQMPADISDVSQRSGDHWSPEEIKRVKDWLYEARSPQYRHLLVTALQNLRGSYSNATWEDAEHALQEYAAELKLDVTLQRYKPRMAGRLWNVGSGEALRAFMGHEAPVRAVAISVYGSEWVVTVGVDGTMIRWGLSTGTVEWASDLGFKGERWWLALNPSAIAVGNDCGEMRFLDAATGSPRSTTGEVLTTKIIAADAAPDGRLLIGDAAGNIGYWYSNRQGNSWEQQGAFSPNEVLCLAFSSDPCMVASGHHDGFVRLCDLMQKLLYQFGGCAGPVCAVAITSDGKRVAASYDNGDICVWEVSSGQRRVLREKRGRVCALAFSSDGEMLVAGIEDHQNRDLLAWLCSRYNLPTFSRRYGEKLAKQEIVTVSLSDSEDAPERGFFLELEDEKARVQDSAKAHLRKILIACVNRLPDNYRSILILSCLEDKTTGEVSQELRMSEGNVRVNLHRARQMAARCVRVQQAIEAILDWMLYRSEITSAQRQEWIAYLKEPAKELPMPAPKLPEPLDDLQHELRKQGLQIEVEEVIRRLRSSRMTDDEIAHLLKLSVDQLNRIAHAHTVSDLRKLSIHHLSRMTSGASLLQQVTEDIDSFGLSSEAQVLMDRSVEHVLKSLYSQLDYKHRLFVTVLTKTAQLPWQRNLILLQTYVRTKDKAAVDHLGLSSPEVEAIRFDEETDLLLKLHESIHSSDFRTRAGVGIDLWAAGQAMTGSQTVQVFLEHFLQGNNPEIVFVQEQPQRKDEVISKLKDDARWHLELALDQFEDRPEE